MRATTWSVIVTGAAAGLLGVAVQQGGDLRMAGVVGGALVALVGVALGGRAPASRRAAPPGLPVAVLPRFFRDRRGAAREPVEKRVRVAVDGRAYDAVLLNVSSSGALLRLPPHVARRLRTEVGTPVRIEDQPAGAIARVGERGVYVDFAVALTPAAGASGGSPPLPPPLA